jgi:hypothetical protein
MTRIVYGRISSSDRAATDDCASYAASVVIDGFNKPG